MRIRISFLAAVVLLLGAVPSSAQTYAAGGRARRHFVTVSYDWLYNQTLHFAEHPIEDLLGTAVASAQLEDYDYRTRDDLVLIDVGEFIRRTRGGGVTVYPLGMSSGAALALRGSYENMPAIEIQFEGPAPFATYALTNARAYDAGAGLYIADRSAGWGLGSHAFVLGGIGRITSDLGDGRRYFAEGGGGLSAGPLGVELAIKFAWNHLSEPVDHSFLLVPLTFRGTLTF